MDDLWQYLVVIVVVLTYVGPRVYCEIVAARGYKPAPRRAIPREVQEEIDVTQEWWDREFARLEGKPPPPRYRFESRNGIGMLVPLYPGHHKMIPLAAPAGPALDIPPGRGLEWHADGTVSIYNEGGQDEQ